MKKMSIKEKPKGNDLKKASIFLSSKKENTNKSISYFKKKILKKKRSKKNFYKKYKVELTKKVYFRVRIFNKIKFIFLKKIFKRSYLNKKINAALMLKKRFLKKISIKVTQNNIFCTFIDLKKNKTLLVGSSGIYKIKVSKRKLKHFYKNILLLFFMKVSLRINNFRNSLFSIIAPIRIRKKICQLINSTILNKKVKASDEAYKKFFNILVNVIPKKCFNGCRVKKKIKKKRRLYRIFK